MAARAPTPLIAESDADAVHAPHHVIDGVRSRRGANIGRHHVGHIVHLAIELGFGIQGPVQPHIEIKNGIDPIVIDCGRLDGIGRASAGSADNSILILRGAAGIPALRQYHAPLIVLIAFGFFKFPGHDRAAILGIGLPLKRVRQPAGQFDISLRAGDAGIENILADMGGERSQVKSAGHVGKRELVAQLRVEAVGHNA